MFKKNQRLIIVLVIIFVFVGIFYFTNTASSNIYAGNGPAEMAIKNAFLYSFLPQ